MDGEGRGSDIPAAEGRAASPFRRTSGVKRAGRRPWLFSEIPKRWDSEREALRVGSRVFGRGERQKKHPGLQLTPMMKRGRRDRGLATRGGEKYRQEGGRVRFERNDGWMRDGLWGCQHRNVSIEKKLGLEQCRKRRLIGRLWARRSNSNDRRQRILAPAIVKYFLK